MMVAHFKMVAGETPSEYGLRDQSSNVDSWQASCLFSVLCKRLEATLQQLLERSYLDRLLG